MYTESLMPRFSDTDALGHINNTTVPVWFEGAREPVFKLFTPDLDPKDWHLIIAKIEINYHGQLFFGQPIEIRTYIGRIGGASFDVYQELWQHNEKCASGTAALVYFDYEKQSSKKLSEDLRAELSQHLYSET